jgi:hypothetical protein
LGNSDFIRPKVHSPVFIYDNSPQVPSHGAL